MIGCTRACELEDGVHEEFAREACVEESVEGESMGVIARERAWGGRARGVSERERGERALEEFENVSEMGSRREGMLTIVVRGREAGRQGSRCAAWKVATWKG